MIIIFDLDDTLYDEGRFVDSGLAAVAAHGATRWGWDAAASVKSMRGTLATEGRGRIFDRWLSSHDAWSSTRVNQCIKIYRHHLPQIELFPGGRRMLDRYRSRAPLFLVTDGHKLVQRNKVDALGVWPDFRRVFITHRFGIAAAKPSTYCFERIRAAVGCHWSEMVYVGDNPAKDFVSLNPLGALTVRVLTGSHRDVAALPGHDAKLTIPSIDALPDALATRFPAEA